MVRGERLAYRPRDRRVELTVSPRSRRASRDRLEADSRD